MASSVNYELVVDDFKDKGVQISIKKRNGRQILFTIALAGIVVPNVYTNLNVMQPLQVVLLLGCTCIFILLFVNLISSINTETLLIISSVGINVRRSTIFCTSSIFYNLPEIQDIVIVEAVTMYKIIFQLVLIPKNENCTQNAITQNNNNNNVRKKLHPLFQSFNPKLKDLKIIYQQIQEKLFHIHQDDS